ncbi:hypothetical protein L3X37_03350 [Sabulilitoribacter arenilitoris]|uniref:Uncharacterized protein n=1 Tax=Wocania arenilitoris TaxID=2044858 RepID=A0AAE3EM35_9FLAO|nr:hypothetical protein [Wocania arenilitoris]MCF7567402.1 hypothetical protein [Wocania arenilitoris]
MNDFVIKKKEGRTSKVKSFSFNQSTKKEFILILKTVAFFGAFLGLIYLSISRNNLMLSELLTVGGILSIVFLIHILSNR